MDDLGENKDRLRALCLEAKPGDVLVDLGVRTGTSSCILLESGQRVIGVDPAHCTIDHPNYTFLQTDSVTAAAMIPAPIFLCFVDTLHIKEQVMAEMFHYWPKIRVGGYAVFHDTEWPEGKHDEYLGKQWGQAVEGVAAYFGIAIEHVDIEHHPESWGMTVVKKLNEWIPVVEGMEEALRESRRLTEALCR